MHSRPFMVNGKQLIEAEISLNLNDDANVLYFIKIQFSKSTFLITTFLKSKKLLVKWMADREQHFK